MPVVALLGAANAPIVAQTAVDFREPPTGNALTPTDLQPGRSPGIDSSYAWMRLAISMLLATIGGVGMWAVVVVLPAVQAEFGVDRAAASMPYTATMVGFAAGNVLVGRAIDRMGYWIPALISSVALARRPPARGAVDLDPAIHPCPGGADRRRHVGDLRAADRRHLALVQPPARRRRHGGGRRQLSRRRALADHHADADQGGRLALHLCRDRRLLPGHHGAAGADAAARRPGGGGRRLAAEAGRCSRSRCRRRRLQVLLVVAGLGCCVAMSMPQVHIVAYCMDLGYGIAHGADMLSIMMAAGVVSRLASGFLADRIGGVKTLLIGSVLQCLSLLFYIPVRRACLALCRVAGVRPVARRHRALLCHHRARISCPPRRPASVSASS